MRTFSSRLARHCVVVAMAFALLATACGSDDAETNADPDSTTSTSADDGSEPAPDDPAPDEPATDDGSSDDPQTLVIAVPSDVLTLDLGKETFFGEAQLLSNVYDSLTTRAGDGGIEPGLATEWTVSDDGTAWTISLRQGVLFHNGDEMTATDVAYSIVRHTNPDFPGNISSIAYGDVESVDIVDDYTIVVNLSEANALFMQGTPLFSPIVNSSIAEQYSIEDFGSSAESVEGAGTGPFRVISWQRDDQLVLSAFDEYWGGAPAVDELIIRPIPDAAARTAALLTGEADIITPLAVEEVALLEGDANLEARSVAGLERVRMILNNNTAPFDQLEVRQAVAHAIDVQSIVDELLLGFAFRTGMYAVPIELGFNPDLAPIDYDVDLARSLMSDAGYADGFDVDFHVRTNSPKAEEIGQVIVAQLGELGINANMIPLESADFNDLAKNNEITLGLTTHNGGGQFHSQFGLNVIYRCDASSANAGFYCNPALDAAVDSGNQLALTDQAASIAAYQEALQVCYDDQCDISLYGLETLYGVNSAVTWDPPATGSLSMATASVGS